ncbi:MAG TPA: DUF2336 domain-containing protein [Pseudolabrys sp.]|nr:DUF2336 domain-containing protein [Pseudolabrys sp.]
MANPAVDTSRLLTDALADRTAGDRGRVVREIADLFLRQPASYSNEQIELFDNVLMKMVDQIDEEVRAHLSEGLSAVGNAPRQIVRHLASDEAISVAGPMLAQSPCLDESFLVTSAKTKSQAHLVAISSRPSVGPRLSDALVDRGDDAVVLTLARNRGAEFSTHGRALIVERAKDNADLAHVVWNREDIPRQEVLALFDKVSELVRQQFEAAGTRAPEVAAAVMLARRKLQEKSQETSSAYASARAHIDSLQETGGLSQSHLLTFASQQKFEEVVVALSELSRLSSTETESMLLEEGSERLIVVAKAVGLPWNCLRLILLMNRVRPKTFEEIEYLRTRFQSISREAAAKGLQFHQLRERARNGPRPGAN